MNTINHEEKKTSHQISKLPKIIGDYAHFNQFLKFFCVTLTFLLFLSVVVILFLENKKPLVITMDVEGHLIKESSETLKLPKVEDEIKSALKAYLQKRYEWNPQNINEQIKNAENFIQPQTLKSFRDGVSDVLKFSVEKNVSQKIYPNQFEIDLTKNTAILKGDRITSIQGLKAAGNLNLELTFEFSARTKLNPWGIYISKEKEL